MALKGIDDTLAIIMACADNALKESQAPVCVVSTTIGEPVIENCCECAPGTDGELWGHLRRAYPGDRDSGLEIRAKKSCGPTFWFAQYQITLARCFPTIDDRGEVPDPIDRASAASTLHTDVAVIQHALRCCTEIDEIPYVENVTVMNDPSGGCSKATITLRAPVSMARAQNVRIQA